MVGGFPAGNDVCRNVRLDGFDVPGTNAASTCGYDNYQQTSTSANTKTAWFNVVASAFMDICVVAWKSQMFLSASAGGMLAMDIGVGPSGSEKILLPNLLVECNANGSSQGRTQLPLQIPAGTPISFRFCETSPSSVQNFPAGLHLIGFDGGFVQGEGFAGADDIGTSVSGSPYSTTLSAAGINSFGSWTQLVASTANDYAGFLIFVGQQGAGDTTNFPWTAFQFGIGAAAAEIAVEEVAVQTNWGGMFDFVPLAVPAGTRLSGRAAHATSTTEVAGMAVFGVYA